MGIAHLFPPKYEVESEICGFIDPYANEMELFEIAQNTNVYFVQK